MNIPTEKHNQFPVQLLNMSDDVRLSYFKAQKIGHPSLMEAHENVLSMLRGKAGPEILIVTGPSGVGKSTLLGKLEETLLAENAEQMQQEKDFLPVVRLDANAPHQKNFSWKDFYTRLLVKMDETSLQYKLPFGYNMYDLIDMPRDLITRKATSDALQRCAENCLHYRKTKVLLIDEASVMLLKSRGTPPVHLFEAIKSLSINSGAKIVLVGTYRLLEIMEQSAQLIRRSRVVHMARYSNGFKDDREIFANILRSFQAQMPIENIPDFVEHAEALYLKSVGCVGILHSLLLAWFEHALKTGETAIEDDFLDSLISNFSVKQVLEEAFAGEQKLRDIPLDNIRKMLDEHNKGIQLPDTNENGKPKEKRGRNLNGVGKRNPKRDPVGSDHVLF